MNIRNFTAESGSHVLERVKAWENLVYGGVRLTLEALKLEF